MNIDRRDALKLAVLAALAGAVPVVRAAPRRILILGGTGFLGPHIVEAAQARGHTVTLFNRGKTNPGLFPDVEKLKGDRRTDLGALANREFDAVIDTSGYFPADVKRSAELLASSAKHYLFVSTISVYASMAKPNDESSPVATTDEPDAERITGENYGPLKALCEEAAKASFPDGAIIVRPGLIVGPGDPTDRFTYWPARIARGGDVLAPGAPENPTQFIDARDLAAFIVKLVDDGATGTFNADAPVGALTMGKVLDACVEVAGNDAKLTWVPASFLAEHGVAPWQDMPIWMPASGEEGGFGQVSVEKAIAAGLTHRPLEATVRDTLAWYETWPADRKAKLRAGIAPEREQAVLSAWHAHAHEG